MKLKVDAKVMLTVNIDLQDRPTNGQTGINSRIGFAQVSARKVYSVVNMDNMAKVFERQCDISRYYSRT